jgi:hypothetical protein
MARVLTITSERRKRDWIRPTLVAIAQVVLALGVVVLFFYALLFAPEKTVETDPAKTMVIALPQDLVRLDPGRYCRDDKVDLLLVYITDQEKGIYATVRASGTIAKGFSGPELPDEVRIRLERGAEDASVTPVLSALPTASDAHLVVQSPCPRQGHQTMSRLSPT